MSWRPLSQSGGRTTRVKFEADGTVLFHTEQDWTAIKDRNAAFANHDDKGWFQSGEMRRVASIPTVVINQWLQEGIDVFSGEHQAEVAKRLNSSEYSYLRTAPGHLGPVGDGTWR